MLGWLAFWAILNSGNSSSSYHKERNNIDEIRTHLQNTRAGYPK